MLGFYDPPTAKVIQRQDLGLKSHPKKSLLEVKNFSRLIKNDSNIWNVEI